VTESAKSKENVYLETSIPKAGASLESILCTEELQRRVSRPPDYEKENRALVALMGALADSPSSIFQTLAETILDITQCDSAGLSLLTRDGKTPDVCGQRFYWPAIAGMWNPHVGGGTPRNFGPCGDVLDQNRTLLFRHFERRYPYLMPVNPAAEECLLVPFYVAGEAVGTIWGIMHSGRRKFDAEDDRVMASLGKFASSAYQAVKQIQDLKFQVAEREKAEAEVRELAKGLEAKVRRLVDANVVGIVLWNLEGAITAANDAFLRMVQYDREDLASGRVRWTDLTPAEWSGHDERAIADLKTTGIFQPFEKEYFRKDGSRVPVLLGGALFEESRNEGVAFVLDLTEQKRAEEALRRSEGYLAQAQRLAHIGSWAWEIPRLNGSYASEEWYRIHDLNPQDGVPTWEQRLQRIHPEDRPRYQAAINRAIAEKSGYDVEFRILRSSSQRRYIHSVGHPVLSPSGELLQFVGVAMDVTESKRAEEERQRLRQVQADLAHVTRVSTMGELTAALAHEIKQPIGAAVTNAEACVRFIDRREPELPEAREAALDMIKDARLAAEIIDRVRLLYQKGASQLEAIDLNRVIEEMISMMGDEANRHAVMIRTDLAPGLPNVMADRVQLQQALMNLILNGIEAMQDTGGELSIGSQLALDGQLLVSVSDTGVGLPVENLGKIFNAFFTTKARGTGLGLAITRSVIQSHGGHIWATANSGRGATFQFTLPQKKAAHA
jgi:PAS domain S-box-containing protein